MEIVVSDYIINILIINIDIIILTKLKNVDKLILKSFSCLDRNVNQERRYNESNKIW